MNPITDGNVLSFVRKLRRVVENSDLKIGTRETTTDSLVDDLLRIVNFNTWPLTIRLVFIGKLWFRLLLCVSAVLLKVAFSQSSNHPSFNIYIKDSAYVSSIPEFAVMKDEVFALVVIEVCMSLIV